MGLVYSFFLMLMVIHLSSCRSRCNNTGSLPDLDLKRNNRYCTLNFTAIFKKIPSMIHNESCSELRKLLTEPPTKPIAEMITKCVPEFDKAFAYKKTRRKTDQAKCYIDYCEIISGNNSKLYQCCFSGFLSYINANRPKDTVPLLEKFFNRCKRLGTRTAECIDSFVELCFREKPTGGILNCVQLVLTLCKTSRLVDEKDEFCVRATLNEVGKMLTQLCYSEQNQQECDQVISDILHELNATTSSLHLLFSALDGISRNTNLSQHTLKQLEVIMDTFENEEKKVSENITEIDATIFIGVFDTLLDREQFFISEGCNGFGERLLFQLEHATKLLGLSLLNENGRLEGNFSYFGSHVYLGYFIGNSSLKDYVSSKHGSLGSVVISKENNVGIPMNQVCGMHSRLKVPNLSQDNRCNPINLDFECTATVATLIITDLPNLSQAIGNDPLVNSSTSQIVSPVISTQIITNNANNVNITSGNVTFNFTLTSPVNTNMALKCVYWDFKERNWSTFGLITQRHNSTSVQCISSHLTSFAVLLDHQGMHENEVFSNEERHALSGVGYIGTVISLISSITTMIMLITFRKKLNRGPLLYVHFNLVFSLSMALIVLIGGMETATSNKWLCSVVAGLLHYFFLCVFCWMLAEGIMLYLLIVKVFTQLVEQWYTLILLGWGLPLIIVSITAVAANDQYGNTKFCWLSVQNGMIWAFVGPTVFIILVNIIILIIAEISIIRTRRRACEDSLSTSEIVKPAIKGAVVLLPLLGITWIIGLFTVNSGTTFFLWLFTILNSLQGFAILYFHVLRNQEVRLSLQTLVKKWWLKCNSCTSNKKSTRSDQNCPIQLQTLNFQQSQQQGAAAMT